MNAVTLRITHLMSYRHPDWTDKDFSRQAWLVTCPEHPALGKDWNGEPWGYPTQGTARMVASRHGNSRHQRYEVAEEEGVMTAPLTAAESFPAPEPAFVSAGNHDITLLTTHVSVIGGRIIGSVRLNAHQDIFCRAPEQARDIARAFAECAALMEARRREAAPQDVPRPGNLDESPGERSVPGPGHHGHALRPPGPLPAEPPAEPAPELRLRGFLETKDGA